ncbi:MAG: lipopolysaccharide heptosyltransferase II [Thermoanaerobaculia bacterium]|nr:lipopolysaccharide heptosyltransferase II [Thermoanaerobaculia bacterium]
MSARPTLLVAPNWVGDVVMALPTLEALAGAGHRLHVLARPHLLPLLGLSPAVDQVVARTGDAETIAAIRARDPADAVILPNSFRSAWLPFRAGVARRWGYRGQLRGALLSRPVRRRRGRRPQVEEYRELVAALGADLPESPVPRLALDSGRERRGAELLVRAGLPAEGGPRVGLFPGAAFGPSKRWPEGRFGELARTLRRRIDGARLVIVAGPGEVWLAVKVHEAVARATPVVGPDLDLADLAAVLGRLDLLITNDSGPMHLAAALGVPCLALFGPTDPRRTAPSGEGHTVLWSHRWCSPCFRRRCPLVHHGCMKDHEVESVAESALRGLGRS